MTQTKHSTVVAVFPNRGRAESAIDELWHAGFRHDQIGILIPGKGVTEATTATEGVEENAATGASVGAITGGALGALLGAVAVAVIPGIGPVLAGGILVGVATTVAAGAAAGAAVGTFLGPFIALGFSEEEASHYERELQAGRTIVTVQAEDREDEVLQILSSHGPTRLSAPGKNLASHSGEATDNLAGTEQHLASR